MAKNMKSKRGKQGASSKNSTKNASGFVKLTKTRLAALSIKSVKPSQERYVSRELFDRLTTRNADRLLQAKKYKGDILSKRQRDQIIASEGYGETVTLEKRGKLRKQYQSNEDGKLPPLLKIKRYQDLRERRESTGWLPENEWSEMADWAKTHDAGAVNWWFRQYTHATIAAE